MHGPLPGRGSEQACANVACWSQREWSQWLAAGGAEASAGSSPVGLSLSATTWYCLPVGGWQQQGPGVSDGSGRSREEAKGPGRGSAVLLSEAGCWGCTLSQSNSFRINWAGYGGIWLWHRAAQDSACTGAPGGFWNQPSAARHNYFQQCLSATET